MSISLVDKLEEGLSDAKYRPAGQYFRWARRKVGPALEDFTEDAIHVSDYPANLPTDDKKCPRQLWLRTHGEERKDPSLGEKIMWSQGKAFQYRMSYYIEKAMSNEWSGAQVERPVNSYLPNTDIGRADLVFLKPDEVLVVEIKTQRGSSFQHLECPKDSHVLQLEGYMFAFEAMGNDNVTGKLLYLDREGQNRPKEFEITRGWPIKQVSNNIGAIVEGIKPNKLRPQLDIRKNKGPNSIKLKQPWQCRYCDYRGFSCPGALSDELTGYGIVAHVEDGAFSWDAQSREIKDWVKKLYNEREEVTE